MLDWLFGTPYPLARRVIVNTKDGQAFRGVLWQRKRDFLVLRDAAHLPKRQDPVPMDGEVLLFRPDVAFIQVVTVTEDAH